MSLILVPVQQTSRRFDSPGVLFILEGTANHHRLSKRAHLKHIKQNGEHGKFRSTQMYHSFLYFFISHSCLPLAHQLYKFTAVPSFLFQCSCFLSLIAEHVCIDTAPRSYTAVCGQGSPTRVKLNGKINDSGYSSGMPPSAVTGRREEERKCKEKRSRTTNERSIKGKKKM